jgi:hypothetical protein
VYFERKMEFQKNYIEMKNTFIETSLMQYYENNSDDILYDHDGIKMKELLLVSRIIYPLLNKANKVKVEAHMPPPLPLTSLSIDPQYPIYKIENNRKKRPIKIHAYKL